MLIFRRIQLYTCSIWYCHSPWEFLVACRYTAWVITLKRTISSESLLLLPWNLRKGKCKADRQQVWTGSEGSENLRLPDFVTTAQHGGRLSVLCTGRLYPQEYSWYSFSLGAESTPGPWFHRKNPVTPPGIDSGTFRLVAQRLNHYATPRPVFT